MAYRNATRDYDALLSLVRSLDRQIAELTAAHDFEHRQLAYHQRRRRKALAWSVFAVVAVATIVVAFGWGAWVMFTSPLLGYAAGWLFLSHRPVQRSERYVRALCIALAMTQRHHQDAKSMLRDLDYESEYGRTEGEP